MGRSVRASSEAAPTPACSSGLTPRWACTVRGDIGFWDPGWVDIRVPRSMGRFGRLFRQPSSTGMEGSRAHRRTRNGAPEVATRELALCLAAYDAANAWQPANRTCTGSVVLTGWVVGSSRAGRRLGPAIWGPQDPLAG